MAVGSKNEGGSYTRQTLYYKETHNELLMASDVFIRTAEMLIKSQRQPKSFLRSHSSD